MVLRGAFILLGCTSWFQEGPSFDPHDTESLGQLYALQKKIVTKNCSWLNGNETPDWTKLHMLPYSLTPLGIMGLQLRAPLKSLDTIQTRCLREALRPIMRDASPSYESL